jgi:hypothetical protein
MKIIILLFLLLNPINGTFSQTKDKTKIDSLIDISGYRVPMNYLAVGFIGIVNNQLINSKVKPFDSNITNLWIDSAFSEMPLLYETFFSSDEINSLLKTYQKPTFVKLGKCEQDLSTFDTSFVDAYYDSIKTIKTFGYRYACADSMVDKYKRFEIYTNYHMFRGLYMVLNHFRPLNNRLADTIINKMALNTINQFPESPKNNKIKSFLYQYRLFDDHDWKEFMSFYNTKIGNKYKEFHIEIFNNIISHLALYMGKEIDKRNK